MILTTTERIPGKEYQIIGPVVGSEVRAKHIGKQFMAGLKTLVGGEVTQFTELLAETKKAALDRMAEEAKAIGADAVVCYRYFTADVMDGTIEVAAYGTAVKYI